MNYLKELEYEAIYIIREVAAQFENGAILFSCGKDSITIAHLAKKAFFSGGNSVSARSYRHRT